MWRPLFPSSVSDGFVGGDDKGNSGNDDCGSQKILLDFVACFLWGIIRLVIRVADHTTPCHCKRRGNPSRCIKYPTSSVLNEDGLMVSTPGDMAGW